MTDEDVTQLDKALMTLRQHGYRANKLELPLSEGVIKLELSDAPPEELSPMERKAKEPRLGLGGILSRSDG